MFASNTDANAHVLTVTNDSGNTLAASATSAPNTKETILKIVNYGSSTVSTTIKLNGGNVGTNGTLTVLTSGSLNDENSFSAPNLVAPKSSSISISSSFTLSLAANSVNILRLAAY